MSSSVCQGLQSCLEPRLTEPRPLRHKMAQPRSNFCHSFPSSQSTSQQKNEENSHSHRSVEDSHQKNNVNNNCCGSEGDHKSKNSGDLGGWSFLQALTNTSNHWKEVTDETNKVYVHPLVKQSSSALGMKSLEMCTESLGSETGSDIGDGKDEFTPFSRERQNLNGIRQPKSGEFMRKLTRSDSFPPPPLTSVSGSEGVQVKSHRQGGRLVIEAVIVSSSKTFFHAERVNGRLKLSLLKDSSVNCEHDEVAKNEGEVCNEYGGEEAVEPANLDGEGAAKEEFYDDDDDDEVADDADEADGDGASHDGYWCEDMDGNGERAGCEIGIGELRRPLRCKVGGTENKEMSNWGPCCVAIS